MLFPYDKDLNKVNYSDFVGFWKYEDFVNDISGNIIIFPNRTL
jgi:hypothetical protein